MIHWADMARDQRIEAIKAVWQPGMSASEIAARLDGPSRNAIAAMFGRFGPQLAPCHLRGKPARTTAIPSLRPVREKGVGIRGGKVAVRRLAFAAPPVSPLPCPPALGLTLMQLGPRQCRWCVNDPEPKTNGHLFCGHDTDLGETYCQHHRERSIGAGTESERSAPRALKAA